MNYCIDCSADISGMHHNQKRCIPCRDKHRAEVRRKSVKQAHKRHPESHRRTVATWKKKHPEEVRAYQAHYFQKVTKSKRQKQRSE